MTELNREELFNEHYPDIEKILTSIFGNLNTFASKYRVEVEDIVQMGYIGLWNACKYYKEDKSKFSTYMFSVIYQSVLRELKKVVRDVYNKSNDQLKSYNQVQFASMDAKIKNESNENVSNLYDYIENDNFENNVSEIVEGNLMYEELRDTLNQRLRPKDLEVIELLEKGYTASDISRIKGVYRQGISERIRKIRRILKEEMGVVV